MSRFSYTLHNLVGHPLMEILGLLGMHKAAKYVHDYTLPKEYRPHD